MSDETAVDSPPALALELIPVQHGTEADVTAFNRQGEPIEVPHHMVVRPYFMRGDEMINVLYARLLRVEGAQEQEMQKSVLQMSGGSGRLRASLRSAVVPALLKPKS